MPSANVAQIERELGVHLPEPYRGALEHPQLSGDDDDHPEFCLSADDLVKKNAHFKFDPEDLSDLEAGMLGPIKRLLFSGTRASVLERRRKWHEEWAGGQRFIIGSDLGEEWYYIVLSEPNPKVYCYELESHQSREVAASIGEWIAEVNRLQEQANRES